jgi:hypothetical protein
MSHGVRRSFIGQVVRIRETDELAAIIADNLYLESERTKWRAVVRTLSGPDQIYFLSQLETEIPKAQVLPFRIAFRLKFPELPLT